MEKGYNLVLLKKSEGTEEMYTLAYKPSEVEPLSPITENLEEAIQAAEEIIKINEAPSFINFNPDKDKFRIFVNEVEANGEILNCLGVRVVVDYAYGTFIPSTPFPKHHDLETLVPSPPSPKNQVRYNRVKLEWERNKDLREYKELMTRTLGHHYN